MWEGPNRRESSAGPQWWNWGNEQSAHSYAISPAYSSKGSPCRAMGQLTEGVSNQKLACTSAQTTVPWKIDALGFHCLFRPATVQSSISSAVSYISHIYPGELYTSKPKHLAALERAAVPNPTRTSQVHIYLEIHTKLQQEGLTAGAMAGKSRASELT